jgi:abnormal spindle-like microcephaly-associated protein
MYRGHLARRKLGKRSREIRRRAREANARFHPKLTLAARTSSALEILLTHKQLAYVLRACENLDVATKLSHHCCVKLVTEGAVPIIFQLIRSCNRSAPHTAVLVRALHIVAHLTVCAETVDAVASEASTLDLLVGLIQMYRDNEEVLSVCVDVLSALAKDSERLRALKAEQSALDRIPKILQILERKALLASKLKRGKVSARGIAVSTAQLKLLYGKMTA